MFNALLQCQVYAVLSGLCQIGEQIRHRDAEPFLSALAGGDFGGDAEDVAVSHMLNLAQKLDAASNVDSLFQVRAGEIKLRLRRASQLSHNKQDIVPLTGYFLLTRSFSDQLARCFK